MNDHSPTPEAPRRLARNTHDAWFGGVCAGLADYFRIDRNLVRLIVAVATVLGFGSVALAYIAAWILMPRR